MSATDLTIAPDVEERRPASSPTLGRRGPAWWPYLTLACALLAAGGGLRWWQERRVLDLLSEHRDSPFPLKSLPTRLGPWRVGDEGELELEGEVLRILGCTDYIRRNYVNEQTGVQIEVLVLYGPATIAHRPDLCYPGSGYVQVDGPRPRATEVPGGRVASYDSLVFAKGDGAFADRQQVAFSLRYGGRWTAEANIKEFGRLPGLYKIQLARRIGDHERLDAGTPSEAFLELMLPEIERGIVAAQDDRAGGPGTEAPR